MFEGLDFQLRLEEQYTRKAGISNTYMTALSWQGVAIY
jgi:hypothetical protein